MKKSGFTLAEVLITLGIVGVVSALVLPTFTTKMQTAKVGPRLAKAVAGFEQANIAILDGAQSDALTGVEGLLDSADTYFSDAAHGLVTHMKGSYNNSENVWTFYAADGASYCLSDGGGKCVKKGFEDAKGNIPHLNPITQKHDYAIMIDIDGDNGPGTPGRDRFFFQMMDDGSLRPWGGSWEPETTDRWKEKCDVGAKPASIDDYMYCAGHVMENGLKVEYK